MISIISNHFRLFALALFFVGLVSVAVAYSLKPSRSVAGIPRHARGFTIVTKETITLAAERQSDPKQADYVITKRYRKSDGTWKELKVAYKSGGEILKDQMTFGAPSRGAFRVDKKNGNLVFLSSMPSKETTSYVQVTDGHEHPQFLRDDVVNGYKTYVIHDLVGDDGSYEDDYYAPELDGELIKSVKVAPYGGSVTELVSIELGDPDESVFDALPNLTVTYEEFKGKIEAMEANGEHATAESLRQDLKQQLARELNKP